MTLQEKEFFKNLMNTYKNKDQNKSVNQKLKIHQDLNNSIISFSETKKMSSLHQNQKDNLNLSVLSQQNNLPPKKNSFKRLNLD